MSTKVQNIKSSRNSGKPIVGSSFLSSKHKKLIADILTEKIPSYDTCIVSCQRFIKDKENDTKFWKKELKKYENKKRLAVEILTELGLS